MSERLGKIRGLYREVMVVYGRVFLHNEEKC